MRVIPMLIFFIAALITIRSAAGQSSTVLYIYPLGSSNTGSTQGVTIGTTIVFSCTIPGLSAYTGTGVFGYTELHAIVGGVDTVICSATSTGTCAPGSQGAPYASRSISVDVPTTVGTSFTMTAAVVADSQLSIGYYCKIVAGNVLYSQVAGVTTPLQVYAVANQPTLSFVSSSNAFVSGQALPQITCTANVGAPYGWLQLTASGFIGTSSTAPYPSYLTLVSNSTVLQSDGTYTMTYTFGYSTGTYTLSNSNNNDYFVCYAYNSYVYQSVMQSGVASSALTIQVQYPVTGITVSLSVNSTLSQNLVQSNTNYTLTVSRGTNITLNCSAEGNPPPTYQWTRVSGQNTATITSTSPSAVSSTVSIVETLTLQCNASNTISASPPSYGTSQVATVNVVVEAVTTTIQPTTAQLNTALVVYPLGSSNTTYNQGVQNGSTIVFSCTIPGLDNYTGPFGYTELHAIVGGVDTVICSATATGACAAGSQGAPYTSRSISVDVPTTVGTSFTMTSAALSDSVGYYCMIIAGSLNYTQATGVTTSLLVYVAASQPTLTFVGSSGVYVAGQAMPNITCTANVGAPNGWLGLTINGPSWSSVYDNYFRLFGGITMEPDGTLTYAYSLGYNTNSSVYVLSSVNNNDSFVCYSCNSYTNQTLSQPCIASSQLTMQVQYPVTGITVSLPLNSPLSQNFVQSNTTYTLTVSPGTNITLNCSAEGNPPPTYQWTRLSGKNNVTSSSSAVSSILSIVETLTLQCNASNTISATSPSYGTLQTATVNVVVEAPVTGIAVNMALYRGTLPLGSTLLQRFVQSGTSYTLTVSQGTVVMLYCSAQGHPTPTYQWTRLSGQNVISSSSSEVSSTLSIVETLTLQCNASNTISASAPSYDTSQTATVDIIVL